MAIVFNGSESHLACGLLISSRWTWGGYFCRETAWRPSARCHRHDQCSSIACRDNSSSSTQHRWCHRVRHIDYNYYFANAAVTVDSSHIYDDAVNASSSASWSRFSPSSNLVNEHQSTMWFMVCHWPQSQENDLARPHLCKVAQHWPWPVWKRFIRDHVWRGRLTPGCRTVESVTIVWLTTEANDQSSLHCVIVLTDVISDHIGRQDASRRDRCSKTSAYTGQFGSGSMIWSIE